MTYTQCLIRCEAVERYESQRWFNPGPPLTVFVVGRVRFLSGSEKRTTVKQLAEQGYKCVHRLNHSKTAMGAE